MVRRTALSSLPGHTLSAVLATRLLSGHFSGFFVLNVRLLLTRWVKCHGRIFKPCTGLTLLYLEILGYWGSSRDDLSQNDPFQSSCPQSDRALEEQEAVQQDPIKVKLFPIVQLLEMP